MNKRVRSFVQPVVSARARLHSKQWWSSQPIHTVAELQQQIHDDLRRQHPEWIEPGGESPMCDFYEARLSQLLQTCGQSSLAKVA